MKIDKFQNPQFGSLTTLTSGKTGAVLFIAKEVAEIWGHTNATQAIKDAGLDSSEYKVVQFREYPDFKISLTKCGLVSGRSRSITLLHESGMYKLALASNLDKAKPFKDWITKEVLPAIRKTGGYSMFSQGQKLLVHTSVAVQKANSKEINAQNFENGIDTVIEYNRNSCILHTGHRPSEIKKLGKEAGLKAAGIKDRSVLGFKMIKWIDD